MDILSEIIQAQLSTPNDYIFGFADMRGMLDEKYIDYPFAISIGRKLDDNIINAIENGPTLDYYHYYNQINTELATIASKIQKELTAIGIHALEVEPTVMLSSEKYLQTLSVDVSHKMVGTRAGLGWIGKTDLFISKAFGPRVRLVSILIDTKPANLGIPIEKSRCGNCTICVTKCPAQAANGKLWNIHVHRDEFFNPHLCREKAEYLGREILKIDRRLCGICVSVCPIGKKKIG